jgi:hypothetical protein
MLTAGFGSLFHGLLGLLLGADEEHLAAFPAGRRQKIAGALQLRQRLA